MYKFYGIRTTAPEACRLIIATFENGRSVNYTAAILEYLKTDKEVICIIDAATGEVLFTR